MYALTDISQIYLNTAISRFEKRSSLREELIFADAWVRLLRECGTAQPARRIPDVCLRVLTAETVRPSRFATSTSDAFPSNRSSFRVHSRRTGAALGNRRR